MEHIPNFVRMSYSAPLFFSLINVIASFPRKWESHNFIILLHQKSYEDGRS
jgi:hypothetical protein